MDSKNRFQKLNKTSELMKKFEGNFSKKIFTGSFSLLDTLVRHNTKYIFGYAGGAILPIYDELYHWERSKCIRHILVRHEQAAAHAADAYARTTGNVGVCFATSGPGATNLVTGIATAQIDSVPMVIVTGQVGLSLLGTDAFQEVDIFGITLPIVKHSYIVHKAELVQNIVNEAFYIARTGRPGTVLIDFPKDIGLEHITNYKPIELQNLKRLNKYRTQNFVKRSEFEKFFQYLLYTDEPLLYIGGGAVISNSRAEIKMLADKFKIPVVVTLKGKGAFDENHVNHAGMLGMHGRPSANFAAIDCDLLIVLGARFDDRVTGGKDTFAARAKVIHIDIDVSEVSKLRFARLPLIGNLKSICKQLLELLIYKPSLAEGYVEDFGWKMKIARWKWLYPFLIPEYPHVFSPQEVIYGIGKYAPFDTIFTTDVGQHQMWAAQFIQVRVRKWITSAGLGTMGYGIPAAVGAKCASPNSQVICISGDASFQMNPQELGTIAQSKLVVKIIIINNNYQGMVRQWQEQFYEGRYSHSEMKKGQPNFVDLAGCYGIKGVQVIKDNFELEPTIRRIFSYKRALVAEFKVYENENCYPMVKPGCSNAEMIGPVKYIKILDKETLEEEIKITMREFKFYLRDKTKIIYGKKPKPYNPNNVQTFKNVF